MYLYTNKSEIIQLSEKLPEAGYEVVKTFAELNGKNWLLFNKKQTAFYEANPNASAEEVFNMQLTVIEEYVPSRSEMIGVLKDRINNKVNDQILRGFVWNEMPVWLSVENQNNYKAAYDLAFQARVMQMNFTEVKFKFGTDEEPVYYNFTSFEEFADFYIKAVGYIQSCYETGWSEKDALDNLTDELLLNKYKTLEL